MNIRTSRSVPGRRVTHAERAGVKRPSQEIKRRLGEPVTWRPPRPLGGGLMAGAESVERDVEDVVDVAGLGGGDLGDADDHVHDLLQGGIGAHVT